MTAFRLLELELRAGGLTFRHLRLIAPVLSFKTSNGPLLSLQRHSRQQTSPDVEAPNSFTSSVQVNPSRSTRTTFRRLPSLPQPFGNPHARQLWQQILAIRMLFWNEEWPNRFPTFCNSYILFLDSASGSDPRFEFVVRR